MVEISSERRDLIEKSIKDKFREKYPKVDKIDPNWDIIFYKD